MKGRSLRFGIFGAGFWTRYQLSAWRELKGVECVAIYNRTASKAEAIAREFGIPAHYGDPEELLRVTRPDFIDNITEVGGHKPLSLLCARAGVPCICQKPMASSLADAREMVLAFKRRRIPFFVHENWRWQTPMQALRRLLEADVIGTPFRARLTMVSGFDCWANQPALRELEQFILTDMGTHLLDVARVLFGQARELSCQTHRTLAPEVKGENVATLLLKMQRQPVGRGQAKGSAAKPKPRARKQGNETTSVIVEMGFAKTPLELGIRECFPETLAFVEGPLGSIELCPNYELRVTTKAGTKSQRCAPPHYRWANPAYDIAHASIVDCNANLLAGLRGVHPAETTGEDNLKTLELVFAAYESARSGRVIRF